MEQHATMERDQQTLNMSWEELKKEKKRDEKKWC